ncbi:MAG: TonB-dependent receptor plug domain-containing protein [Gammaproteobacteria bacterium]
MKNSNAFYCLFLSTFFIFNSSILFSQEDSETIEEVIVTGSYIKGSATDGASPVEIIDRSTIEDIGATTVADITNYLTVNTGSENNADSFNSGSTQGTSNVNLRGLGLSSTLVLIDGRRNTVAASQANDGSVFVDTNSIPTIAIQRVEILKEGAASIYGSDAVAGVANYILRRDFSGLEIDVSQQKTDIGDQTDDRLSFIIGTEFGENNIVFAMSNLNRSPLSASEVDPKYSQIAFSTFGTSYLIYPPGPLTGENAISPSLYTTSVASGPYAGDYTILEYVPDANCLANNGIFLPQPDSAIGGPGGTLCGFLYGPRFNIVNDEDHTSVYTSLKRTLGNGVNLEFDLMQSKVDVNDNPQSPSYPALSYLTLANIVMPGVAGNPFSYPVLFRGRALGSSYPSPNAPREHENDRMSFGLMGTLKNGFDWDFHVTKSSSSSFIIQPDTSTSKFRHAIDGTGGAPGSWNLFDPTANSQALVDYIYAAEERNVESSLTAIDLILNGNMNDIDIAAGFQFKNEDYKITRNDDSIALFAADGSISQNSDLIFLGGGAENDDSRNSTALFVEASKDMNEKLELKAALRYEKLKSDDTVNPKLSVRYQASDNLVLRGSYSTSFREPSLVQIYSDLVALEPLQDFDTSGNAVGGTQFVRVAVASNKNLKPEESDNINLGAIWRPNPKTSLSVDYWMIDYEDVITKENPQGKLRNDPTNADIVRSLGVIVGLTTRTFNAEKVEASGLDIEGSYSMDTSIGELELGFKTAHISKYEIPNGSGGMQDVVGQFNYDNFARSMPETKSLISAELNNGNHKVKAFYKMISDYKTNRPFTSGYGPIAQSLGYTADIGEFNTLDIKYSYDIDMKEGNMKFILGVNNALDEEAPLVFDDANFSYDTRQHDLRGKTIYMGFKYSR